MKNGNEAFCETCGNDVSRPHSLYQHLLAVLENSAFHGVEAYLDKQDRETLAKVMVRELQEPRKYLEQTFRLPRVS